MSNNEEPCSISTYEENQKRYLAAAHAIQSGVAGVMNYDSHEVLPKHLRTGINISMCDSSSLAKLLIDKGIITKEEHMKALADGLEEEKVRYEQRLSTRYGTSFKLS